jgi:hypothetical protein
LKSARTSSTSETSVAMFYTGNLAFAWTSPLLFSLEGLGVVVRFGACKCRACWGCHSLTTAACRSKDAAGETAQHEQSLVPNVLCPESANRPSTNHEAPGDDIKFYSAIMSSELPHGL